MIPYLFYTALTLTICLCFYQVFLQRETFYRLNRLVLLGCLLVSFLLPLFRVPAAWSLQKPRGEAPVATVLPEVAPNGIFPLPQAAPKEATSRARTAAGREASLPAPEQPLHWLMILYWAGVGIFAANFLLQLAKLCYQRYSSPVIRDGRLLIVEVKGNKAPCSFGRWIFINPEQYAYETYCQILAHEKVHARGGHSLDIVLSEMAVVFQWFNPFCWLFRKAVEANLEYLTDAHLIGSETVERAAYQMNLLRVSIPHLPLRITTNYNQSLLKKRIIMMGIKKSNLHTSWKYGFLPVILAAMVCVFNEPLAHSQTVPQRGKSATHNLASTPAEKEGSWFATIKADTVSIEFKAADNRSFNNSTFLVSEFTPRPGGNVSEFALTRQAGTMTFKGRFEGEEGMGHYQFTPDESYRAFLEHEGVSGIVDQDMMAFFLINVKRDYVEGLRKNGYTEISKGDLMAVAALGIDEPFIRMWKESGFHEVALHELITLKALHVDPAYLQEVKEAGLKNVTLSELISLKAQGITGTEIRKTADRQSAAARSATTEPVTISQVIAGHHLQVDSTYVAAIRALGYDDLSYEQLWVLKNTGVTPELIKSFQQVGYRDIPVEALMAIKAQNVSPEYLKSFLLLGYKDIPLSELLAFKTMNITPAYIESFQKVGFKDIPASQVLGLHQAGVTREVVEQYRKVGVTVTSLNDLVAAKYSGVTPEYIRTMTEKGFKFKELSSYQQLKHLSENQ